MKQSSNVDDSSKNTPRGSFNLMGVKRNKKPQSKVIMVIGGGVLFLFVAIGCIFYIAMKAMEANSPDKVDESSVKADAALNSKPITDDDIQKRRAEILRKKLEKEKKEKEEQAAAAAAAAKADAERQQGSNTSTAAGKGDFPRTEAYMRKLAGGIIVQEAGGGSGSSGNESVNSKEEPPQSAAVPIDIDSSGTLASPVDNTRGNLSNLTGTSYVKAKAYSAPDPKFLLKRKKIIRCSLYTAVKTDHPGFVKCILTQPLYSADGSVVLAEAGSELDGEQKVELRPGQSSVFTTFTELDTAAGVRADLNALGTGAMGESGTEAYIDNHYGQRFGGAVMLSFIQDAFATAANSTQKNNSSFSFDNSESNAESMATKALDSSINIPPTGYVLPGTVINVIVAQDIDFSTVFKTRVKH